MTAKEKVFTPQVWTHLHGFPLRRNLRRLPHVVPFLKSLHLALFHRHSDPQRVEGCAHLSQLEVHRHAFKPQAVTHPFLEAWWLIVFRSDFKTRNKTSSIPISSFFFHLSEHYPTRSTIRSSCFDSKSQGTVSYCHHSSTASW